jgi:hypothetical protein
MEAYPKVHTTLMRRIHGYTNFYSKYKKIPTNMSDTANKVKEKYWFYFVPPWPAKSE